MIDHIRPLFNNSVKRLIRARKIRYQYLNGALRIMPPDNRYGARINTRTAIGQMPPLPPTLITPPESMPPMVPTTPPPLPGN